MATCESLQHIIDNPIPENPNPPITPPDLVPSSSSLALPGNHPGSYHRRSESFSLMNIESLQLCTEGLGFESLDKVEDQKMEFNTKNKCDKDDYKGGGYWYSMEKLYAKGHSKYWYRKGKTDRRAFPPPISSIDRAGKSWTSFQSYKEDGRFILKETRIQSQDILHACREDGRLRLNFVHHSEDDDENDDENDDSDDCDDNSNDHDDDERGQEDGM